MILYHFTAPTTSHLGGILRAGEIETTFGIHADGLGPEVVWLSRSSNPADQEWCGAGTDMIKRLAMIAVDAPDARPWPEFAREHEVDPEFCDGLAKAGGGKPEDWFIVDHGIPGRDFEALVVQPVKFGERDEDSDLVTLDRVGDLQTFEGQELKDLLSSRGRQRALNLLETTKR